MAASFANEFKKYIFKKSLAPERLILFFHSPKVHLYQITLRYL